MLVHVFRLMSLCWFALALSWASEGNWPHAALTFAAGVVSYAAGERLSTA